MTASGLAKPASRKWKQLWRERYLWIMCIPGLLFFLVYKYVPMLGIIIAFQDFNPFRGFLESRWVGLKHFNRLLENPDIGLIFWNTLVISFYQIVIAFTVPIILAIMLHEVSNQVFKRFVQTIVYLPHFLSWVVIVGIFYLLFKSDGVVNQILAELNAGPINVMSNPSVFREVLVAQVIWKETGWGTIIYLAALAGIDPELYEAAKIDGAGRLRQIWHVTIPGIRSTIVILFILRLGHVLDVGFEQIYLMLNPTVSQVGEVIETYVYRMGIVNGNYSFTTAVGLLKGLIGLILIVSANHLVKRMGERGVY